MEKWKMENNEKNIYKNFEELKVWQDARILIGDIYRMSANEKLKFDFGFQDQIKRASISILNNIAEGFERNSNADFSKFLMYAKASAGEVRSMLYIAMDLGYISENEFSKLNSKCMEISYQLSGFIKYLRSKIQ